MSSETENAPAPTDRSSETRARILDAALREFSALGMAGARMDQIAATAGVNKALLYYHFDSKEKLYIAALEMISARIRDQSMAVLLKEVSAGERLVRTALNHFDRILAQGEFQSLMQQEMMRLQQGEEGALQIVVKRVFSPLYAMYQAIVLEGIATGELIEAERMQMHLAALGANVFYFLAAPVWRMVLPFDPFAPEATGGAAAGGGGVSGQGGFYGSMLMAPRLRRACWPIRRCRRCRVRRILGEPMNARNRVFMILGLLTLGSFVWYLLTARTQAT